VQVTARLPAPLSEELDASAQRLRIVTAIDHLSDSPAAASALKGEFEGLRRLRVGCYRIVYKWK